MYTLYFLGLAFIGSFATVLSGVKAAEYVFYGRSQSQKSSIKA